MFLSTYHVTESEILLNKNSAFKIIDIYRMRIPECGFHIIEVKDLLLVSSNKLLEEVAINETYEFPIPTLKEIQDEM